MALLRKLLNKVVSPTILKSIAEIMLAATIPYDSKPWTIYRRI